MSTATEISCSDSSALSGRPGVPLIVRSRNCESYAPRHTGSASGVAPMTERHKHPDVAEMFPISIISWRQAPAALSTCTFSVAPSSESQPLLRAPATISSHRFAQSAAVARGSAAPPEGRPVHEGGVVVRQTAEPGALEHLGSLLIGDLPQCQVQAGQVVDVDHPRLRALVGTRHPLYDHRDLLGLGSWPPAGPRRELASGGGQGVLIQTCQGKRVKSGSRFSRKASRPSTASSAM